MKVSERLSEREQIFDTKFQGINETIMPIIKEFNRKVELTKTNAERTKKSWASEMLSNVNINDKTATQEKKLEGFSYINLPLMTNYSNETISWSFKISKR